MLAGQHGRPGTQQAHEASPKSCAIAAQRWLSNASLHVTVLLLVLHQLIHKLGISKPCVQPLAQPSCPGWQDSCDGFESCCEHIVTWAGSCRKFTGRRISAVKSWCSSPIIRMAAGAGSRPARSHASGAGHIWPLLSHTSPWVRQKNAAAVHIFVAVVVPAFRDVGLLLPTNSPTG